MTFDNYTYLEASEIVNRLFQEAQSRYELSRDLCQENFEDSLPTDYVNLGRRYAYKSILEISEIIKGRTPNKYLSQLVKYLEVRIERIERDRELSNSEELKLSGTIASETLTSFITWINTGCSYDSVHILKEEKQYV